MARGAERAGGVLLFGSDSIGGGSLAGRGKSLAVDRDAGRSNPSHRGSSSFPALGGDQQTFKAGEICLWRVGGDFSAVLDWRCARVCGTRKSAGRGGAGERLY